MYEVTRRSLLKAGMMGLSSLILGPLPGRVGSSAGAREVEEFVSLYTGRHTPGRPTTCGLCPVGCGILAFVDEGILVGLAGNPEHPYNRGALCALGSAGLELAHSSRRIVRPLRRQGPRGDGRWEPISWERALGTVATAFGRALRCGPADPVAICLPGHEISPLLLRFVSGSSRFLLARVDGQEETLEEAAFQSFSPGFQGWTDLSRAEVVLNFGANPLGSIRRLVGTARWWAEARGRGARWITVDPRLSETAAASHAWIPVKPGTDGALALALAHLILKNGWEDRRFLEDATDADRNQIWEALRAWAPERAAAVCGVPVEQIRWMAEQFGGSRRSVSIFGSGVLARRGGLEVARVILALNFLVGNIGQPWGYRNRAALPWHQPEPEPAVDRLAPGLSGSLFWDLVNGRRRIGCLLSYHANPAGMGPNTGETLKILRDPGKIPLHIALADHWDETAELADLLVPSRPYLETWGVQQGMAESGLFLSLRQPVLGSNTRGLSLDGLLIEVAARLGGPWKGIFPFRDLEEYYRRLVERNCPVGLPAGAFERLKQKGFLRVPARVGEDGKPYRIHRVLFESSRRLYGSSGGSGGGLNRPGEKTLILFKSPTRASRSFPSEWVAELDHADPIWIHPEAAAELGLGDGDWVLVEGPAGSARTRVLLTEGIHPEAVAAPRGGRERDVGARNGTDRSGGRWKKGIWWKGESYGESLERLVPWPEDPHRESPGWMDTPVRLTRIAGKTRS